MYFLHKSLISHWFSHKISLNKTFLSQFYRENVLVFFNKIILSSKKGSHIEGKSWRWCPNCSLRKRTCWGKERSSKVNSFPSVNLSKTTCLSFMFFFLVLLQFLIKINGKCNQSLLIGIQFLQEGCSSIREPLIHDLILELWIFLLKFLNIDGVA